MIDKHANKGATTPHELPANTAEALRAFVKALAQMAAEADYQENQQNTARDTKGSKR